jgi:hypothetical protein
MPSIAPELVGNGHTVVGRDLSQIAIIQAPTFIADNLSGLKAFRDLDPMGVDCHRSASSNDTTTRA